MLQELLIKEFLVRRQYLLPQACRSVARTPIDASLSATTMSLREND